MGAFSIFKNKKNRKKQNVIPTVEEYYLRLARRTSVAKFILIMIIATFTVFSFSNYRNELTIENFRYTLKFIDFGAKTVVESASVVYFDNDISNKGTLLRGDLCVLNTSGLSIHDFSGTKLLQADFKFDHPKMVANSRSLLVCDLGGNSLKAFNSYSNIYNETFDYPIYGLSSNKNGEFIIISSAQNYRSAFFVYDREFRVIYNYYFGDKYIDYASISEDGKQVLVLLHYSQDGKLISLLAKFDIDSEEPSFQTEFIGEMPLGVNFMTDGKYSVLTSNSLRFYSSDNNIKNEIFFKEKSLLGYEFNNEYVIICYNNIGLSSGTELDIFDKEGNTVIERNFSNAVLDKKISNDTLYVLMNESITIVDLTGEKEDITVDIDSNYKELITNDNEVILFSISRAEYLDTEK